MAIIPSESSPIETLARENTRAFAVYVVFLLVAAVGTALLTVFLWKASNRYQEAVKTEADVRIAEANAEAAKANERAAELEKANLVLRAEIVKLQQRAAEAQRRHNVAQLNLMKLQIQLRPRHLSFKQRRLLPEILKVGPKDAIGFAVFMGDKEARDFSEELASVLQHSGWTFSGITQMMRPPAKGLTLAIPQGDDCASSVFLHAAMLAVGLRVESETNSEATYSHPRLFVGPKS